MRESKDKDRTSTLTMRELTTRLVCSCRFESKGCSSDSSPIISPCLHHAHDYIQLLKACIQSKSLIEGKKIHQHLFKNNNNHINNSTVLDKLTHLYITCNEAQLACRVFDTNSNPNVISWNLVIRSYVSNGPLNRAVDLYYRMRESGVQPNKFTFPPVLRACSGLQAIHDGIEIHDHAKRLGLDSDIFVSTAVMDLYAKSGRLVEAQKVFDNMLQKDVVAWNAMIGGYSLHGLYDDTKRLLIQMQDSGRNPNFSTMVSVLPVVAQANALNQGKTIHGYCLRRSFVNDVKVGSALLDMYAKCRRICYARLIFDKMGVKSEVTWSAMIGAYVISDYMKEALENFDQMVLKNDMKPTEVTLGEALRACAKLTYLSRGRQLHGYIIKSGFILDIMLGNTLLSMYSKCGILDDAIRYFGEMNLKDAVSYSAIISGCMQNGNAEDALLIFKEMQLYGVQPDLATMVGVLPACSHLAALQYGYCTHGYLTVCGFTTDTSVSNALIDMYSKCGEISTARKVFDRMYKRDIVSWNAMMLGYGIHGLGMEALSLFGNLQAIGVKPDDVSFICILSACSHSGLVTEGEHLFGAMGHKFNIVPRMEHYICMVDLLSRAGLLDKANKFIQRMPFAPDVRVWSALLGACRTHKNIKLGEEVSMKIQSLGPEGTGNLVLLSNIYSAAGRWDDAAHVRIMQKNWGLKKTRGCSRIEIDGIVQAFFVGDRSHPQSEQINKKLEELLVEMKRLGYRVESSFVLQDVEEEEKEQILLYHSEKVAIAFGILTLRPNKPILVTNNLRVCGDCHTAIKLISIITKRQITVRDANRFHHFVDGKCNCGDFW